MTKKLLLADDSVTIQRVIGIIFATEDYQLLVTDNGDDAYVKAQQEVPDLVIADVSMPGKDGFELCETLKNDPRLANTAVLLLPGTFDHFDEDRAQAVGADGWLSKPFESQALLDKVEQLLAAEPATPAASVQPQEDEIAEPAENLSGGESVSILAAASATGAAFSELEADPAAELELEFDSEVEETTSEVEETTSGVEETTSEVEETTFEVEETTFEVEETTSEVGAADFGLESVDTAGSELATEETATEDIWDAISFEDDELEPAAAEAEQTSSEKIEAAGSEELAPAETEHPEAELNIDAESIGFAAAEETEPSLESSAGFNSFVSDSDDLLDPEPMEQVETVGSEEVSATLEKAPAAGQALAEPFVLEPEEPALDTAFAESLDPAAPVVEGSGDTERQDGLPEGLALADAEVDAEEEILELAEEDILTEEPLTEVDAGEAGGEIGEPLSTADAEDGVFVLAEEEQQGIDQPLTEPEMSLTQSESEAEEAAAGLEFVEEPVAEEEPVNQEAEEDDGFFFDAAGDEEEEPAVAETAAEETVDEPGEAVAGLAAAGVATGVAATALAAAPDVSDEAPIEQVEQQLRELSEEDLKAVVAKVAGPMIEKLANEMLEQIAWEVVPDLAESMIREEIRRLKQGVE